MENHQVAPVPSSQKPLLPQIARNFKAALSYVSFYSTDSPFVMQSIQKVHKDLQRLLMSMETVVFHVRNGALFLNGSEMPEMEDLAKLLGDKNLSGLKMIKGLPHGELAACLKDLCLPTAQLGVNPEAKAHAHLFLLAPDDFVTVASSEPEAAIPVLSGGLSSLDALISSQESQDEKNKKPTISDFKIDSHSEEPKTPEALLGFVAEAWQFSQLQKKSMMASPEGTTLAKSFDSLFDRLLDRMEKSSPEFSNIYQWFKAPQGELLESQQVAAMFPLLEVAVKNGWSGVLFDPSTEGLVNDCLAHWGANGRQDLVEKTVLALAENLKGDALEKQLALTHLMDARPWVKNADLTQKVLGGLNNLLANESSPGLYQTALLLAWDLTEPALQAGREEPVLALLSTLHFHADEDGGGFPERSRVSRHWLFEKSNPDLIRHFVKCAFKAGQMNHYPLLAEMAAPILLEDYLRAPVAEKTAARNLFLEMKEPIRSALAEKLAETQEESEVRSLFPLLRTCGMDPGLSLLLCAWIAKGSREFKLDLIGLIEEVSDFAGGPALRLALFDDDEEVASLAARVMGKIKFSPGLPVLLKAVKIRGARFPETNVFLSSVCESLGELGDPKGMEFLLDIARKKPLLRGKNFPLAIRVKAVEALTRLNQPEVWHFLETLTEEKNPTLQETLDRIIREKTVSGS